jgi:hypothetical protein
MCIELKKMFDKPQLQEFLKLKGKNISTLTTLSKNLEIYWVFKLPKAIRLNNQRISSPITTLVAPKSNSCIHLNEPAKIKTHKTTPRKTNVKYGEK